MMEQEFCNTSDGVKFNIVPEISSLPSLDNETLKRMAEDPTILDLEN